MQLGRFLKITIALSRKDWDENRLPILAMSAGLFLASFLIALDPSTPFGRGLMLGLVSCCGYLIGQGSIGNERRLGALDMLLSLPVSPTQLILGKYCSCLSITFLVITIPSLVHNNFLIIYRANCLALAIATVFMATTVISDKPWAPQIPFWLLMLILSPLRRISLRYVSLSPDLVAAGLILMIPFLILISATIFSRRQIR